MSTIRTSQPQTPARAARLMASPVVRIVLGIVSVAAPVVLTLWLAHAAFDKSMRVMWPQFLAAVLSVAGYCFYVRRIEKRSVVELSRLGALHELALGALGVAVLLAVTMGALLVARSYQVTGSNSWTILIVPVAELALVAFFEELIFRNIVFRIVEKSFGSWISLGLPR
ncbi:MAG: hypothetical protein ABIN08_19960 [Caldimonas sp.]